MNHIREILINESIAVAYNERTGEIERVEVYVDYFDDWSVLNLARIPKNHLDKIRDEVELYMENPEESKAEFHESFTFVGGLK
jgi:hypothetical protein